LRLGHLRELRNVIYTRMVQKIGNKRYWEQWAQDVAITARNCPGLTALTWDDQRMMSES